MSFYDSNLLMLYIFSLLRFKVINLKKDSNKYPDADIYSITNIIITLDIIHSFS